MMRSEPCAPIRSLTPCLTPVVAQGEVGQFWDLSTALGLLATEGYHAGAVRELLILQAFSKVVYAGDLLVYQVTGVRTSLTPQVSTPSPVLTLVVMAPSRDLRSLHTASEILRAGPGM